MDLSKRYISKICRVAHRYANSSLKGIDLGASEYECLHYIRKNKGISQEKLRNIINIDKSAVSRMITNLERKGYIYQIQDENDKRSKRLFATDKADEIKNATSSVESFFYEWLLEGIHEDEKKVFIKVLNELYVKSKKERIENFVNIKKSEADYYGKVED